MNASNLIYIYILLDAIDVIAIPNLSIIHKSTIFKPFKVTFLASNKQNPLKFRLLKQEKNKAASKIQLTQFTPMPTNCHTRKQTLKESRTEFIPRLTIADSSYTVRPLQQPRTTRADGYSGLSELILTSSQH